MLPLADDSSRPEKSGIAAHDPPPIKILIADDDITNRLVLQGILNYQGYQVLHAENGQEAVELFKREHPDLVFIDVMMPVMDGYQAAERIKKHCGDRFVPVIFLTAVTEDVALAKCIESGGDDFLTKPYNHIILKARMEALLRIRDLYNTINHQKNEIKLYQHCMEREAMMAETLFASIIKSDALEKPYIKYLLSPMSLFNGDVLIAADKPSGGVNVLLGDFTGHGMAAATGALPASSVFYGMTKKGFSVAEIASEINLKMKNILPTGMFLAACIIDMDPVTRSVTVWNGGIPDVLVLSNEDGGEIRRIKSTHLPMGILDASSFDNRVETFAISDGDRFYIYSDGVIETTNPDEVMFGQKRLEQVLRKDPSSQNVFTFVGETLESFRAGREQNDDVTFIELTFDEAMLNDVGNLKHAATKAEHPSSHWTMSFGFDADLLKHSDPLPVLIQSIAELQGLKSSRQQLYTILAELYSNSLEHGLLRLDSSIKNSPEGFSRYYQERELRLTALTEGSIKIDVTHTPTVAGGRLLLRIEDSGQGFDFRRKNVSLENNTAHWGRGVPLIHSLCESVTYMGCGNVVEAIYEW